MSESAASTAPAVSQQPPDPDVELTQREFIDYTEYLPSDIYRYMRLQRSLQEKADQGRSELQVLLREYERLASRHASRSPSIASTAAGDVLRVDGPGSAVLANGLVTSNGVSSNSDRPNARTQELRLQISRCMSAIERAQQEIAAEASRLEDVVKRHHSRVVAISGKLSGITIPSRDPSPEPKPKRRDYADEDYNRQRIILRVPDAEAGPSHRRRLPYTTPRGRYAHRYDDDWDDIDGTPFSRSRKDRRRRIPGHPQKRGPKVPPVDPHMSGGAPSRYEDGTAIPPEKLPWNQLTSEELAKLRKRMKKNSSWTPSITMIIRELELLGRGPRNKERFKDQWESKPDNAPGPEEGGIGLSTNIPPPETGTELENKGIQLNRAKKRKREEEKAAERAERENEKAATTLAQQRRKQAAAEEAAAAEQRRLKAEEEERVREEASRRAQEAAARKKAAEEKAAADKAEADRIAAEKAAAAERAVKEAQKAAREAAALEKASHITKKTTRSSSSVSAVKPVLLPLVAPKDNAMDSSDDELSEPEDLPTSAIETVHPLQHPSALEKKTKPQHPAAPTEKRRVGRPPKPVTDMHRRSTRQHSAVPPTPRTTRGSVSEASAGATLKIEPKRSSSASSRRPGPVRRPGGRKKKVGGDGEEEEDKTPYCLCNKPAGTEVMIECENGEKCPKVWFHVKCVGLTQEEAENIENWFCPMCVKNEPKRGRGRRRGKAAL